jgi:predicted dithiol-disulfide oxidoreductase (DUF899 family)
MAKPHPVVASDQWIEARKRLLIREKEFTKARDQLAAERRALPWERVEKSYVFDGPDGKETLSDLFAGRSQLIVHHFMFDPAWEAGCKSCSFWADNFNGIDVHLAHRDVTLLAVSRAPFAKLEAYRRRMGWSFKWVSSFGSDFNYDWGRRSRRSRWRTEWFSGTTQGKNRLGTKPSAPASSARMRMRCSTPIPATSAASICSTAPITISI